MSTMMEMPIWKLGIIIFACVCLGTKVSTQKVPNRDSQCMKHKNYVIDGRLWDGWKSVYNKKEPCTLMCRVERIERQLSLGPVIDGTPCSPGSADVCEDGACKVDQCAPGMTEDQCRVCGGMNKRCIPTQQYESSPLTPYLFQYYRLVSIPRHATNVKVMDGSTYNYIAVFQGRESRPVLNSDWKISNPGIYELDGGVEAAYEKVGKDESVTIRGPLQTEITIMILLQQPNKWVYYEYWQDSEHYMYGNSGDDSADDANSSNGVSSSNDNRSLTGNESQGDGVHIITTFDDDNSPKNQDQVNHENKKRPTTTQIPIFRVTVRDTNPVHKPDTPVGHRDRDGESEDRDGEITGKSSQSGQSDSKTDNRNPSDESLPSKPKKTDIDLPFSDMERKRESWLWKFLITNTVAPVPNGNTGLDHVTSAPRPQDPPTHENEQENNGGNETPHDTDDKTNGHDNASNSSPKRVPSSWNKSVFIRKDRRWKPRLPPACSHCANISLDSSAYCSAAFASRLKVLSYSTFENEIRYEVKVIHSYRTSHDIVLQPMEYIYVRKSKKYMARDFVDTIIGIGHNRRQKRLSKFREDEDKAVCMCPYLKVGGDYFIYGKSAVVDRQFMLVLDSSSFISKFTRDGARKFKKFRLKNRDCHANGKIFNSY